MMGGLPSHHAIVCETEITLMAYDDVINYFNIKVFGSLADLKCQVLVSFTWFKIACWVIVAED